MVQLTIQQAFDLAVQHHQAGRLREAEELCRLILAQEPQHAGAMHRLGVLAHQAGRSDLAVDLIRQAIAISPERADAYTHLGNALRGMGQPDEAIAAYRQAIALDPNLPKVHNNLGALLIDRGELDEAIAACRQAVALRPEYATAYNNLGGALRNKGELDQAIAAYRQAIALRPNYAEAHINLGIALMEKGEPEEFIAACRQAIALKPDEAVYHWNLAQALLSLGRFAEGWEEFEWRPRVASMKLDRDFPQPLWNGADSPGGTLLIHTEGGFGDALNFVRLVPGVRGRVGKVVLECQPELLRLFREIAGVDEWVARGEALPPFDCRIALQSLPRILGIGLGNIPNSVPYLKPPREGVEQWRRRIGRDGIRNVGLCWAGSRGELAKRTRELGVFAPLAKIAGVRFFSLQKGPEGNQLPPEGMNLIDHTQELSDFADMAALIENLDLVISVDTSIAHLAGALARPVWVLIPNHPDFRWLLDRDDSPWYPTMRLFRRHFRETWETVIARVVNALSDWTENRA